MGEGTAPSEAQASARGFQRLRPKRSEAGTGSSSLGCVAAFSLDKLSQNISWAEGRLAVREEIQNEIKRQAAFIGYHFVIWI